MEEVLQQQDKRIAEQRQKDVDKSNKHVQQRAWLGSCFSRVISSIRQNLEELKSRVNQMGRMSASRDRKKKKEEWDKKI